MMRRRRQIMTAPLSHHPGTSRIVQVDVCAGSVEAVLPELTLSLSPADDAAGGGATPSDGSVTGSVGVSTVGLFSDEVCTKLSGDDGGDETCELARAASNTSSIFGEQLASLASRWPRRSHARRA